MSEPKAEKAQVDNREPWESGWFMAGHCQDIDGGLWHEPGRCPGAVVNCKGDCCG